MLRTLGLFLAAGLVVGLSACAGTDGLDEESLATIEINLDITTACVQTSPTSGVYRRPIFLDHVDFLFGRGGNAVAFLTWDQAELDAICGGAAPSVDSVDVLPGVYVVEGSLRDDADNRLNVGTLTAYPGSAAIVTDVPVTAGAITSVTLSFTAASGTMSVDATWNGSDYD